MSNAKSLSVSMPTSVLADIVERHGSKPKDSDMLIVVFHEGGFTTLCLGRGREIISLTYTRKNVYLSEPVFNVSEHFFGANNLEIPTKFGPNPPAESLQKMHAVVVIKPSDLSMALDAIIDREVEFNILSDDANTISLVGLSQARKRSRSGATLKIMDIRELSFVMKVDKSFFLDLTVTPNELEMWVSPMLWDKHGFVAFTLADDDKFRPKVNDNALDYRLVLGRTGEKKNSPIEIQVVGRSGPIGKTRNNFRLDAHMGDISELDEETREFTISPARLKKILKFIGHDSPQIIFRQESTPDGTIARTFSLAQSFNGAQIGVSHTDDDLDVHFVFAFCQPTISEVEDDMGDILVDEKDLVDDEEVEVETHPLGGVEAKVDEEYDDIKDLDTLEVEIP